MAEARHEEEEELKDASVMCNRNQATDRSERNNIKPDQIQPSSRPLASIRAAFKRTSGRAPSQTDHTRDRRRPEITIVSAEPLASSSWFPGASGDFAPALPPSGWTAAIPVAAKPPPSYDQVIQEKTQEQKVTPTPPPRRSHTTIATQTDTVDAAESSDQKCLSPSQPSSCEGPKLKRPPKPPRPSLPGKPKPAPRGSPLLPTQPAANQTETKAALAAKGSSANAPLTNVIHSHSTEDPDKPLAVSTTDLLESDHSVLSGNIVQDVSDPELSSSSALPEKQQTPRPVPRPRTRSSKPVCPEVKVQTLVRVKDSGDVLQVISDSNRDSQPNPYLKELLEAFSLDTATKVSDLKGSQLELSEESGDESFDMSIRNKIQAFESQVNPTDHVNFPVPVPKPRNQQSKPPVVAPKPALVPRPSVKRLVDENHNVRGNEEPIIAPKSAPPPVLPKKPSIEQRDESPVATTKLALLPPRRPSVLNKPNNFFSQEETHTTKFPPPVLRKPSQEFLNHNNHNSCSLSSDLSSFTDWTNLQSEGFYSGQNGAENEDVNYSTQAPAPPKPVQKEEGFFSRGGATRKPTMIRVPSISAKSLDDSQDAPPPLPVQKPVGGPPPPTHKNSFKTQDSSRGPDLSLPPRPAGGKVLPPRPPPAKAGPGRPPPPRREATQPSAIVPTVAKGQHQGYTSSKTSKKGPALPARPKPGHPLYNKYTLEIPHAIAEFDCSGTNPGELAFQKNEVLVLLDQIDSKTFECQVGTVIGRVQKSYMKIITPLSPTSSKETPQNIQPDASGGMQVVAVYDFTPEGTGELGLKAGDVVSQVEQLDSEWYLGTLRGVTGFFPINYVKVMSARSQAQAKTSSETLNCGPRCVARFSFEAENSDELMFSEGDVIQLQEYIGQEWARGKLGTCVGIFPLNFVDIIEDLPAQTPSALHGMAPSPNMSSNPNQAEAEWGEWAEALYDFTAETEDDLPFQQGDRILVTAHLDDEWCSGRLNGREGVFPKAFVLFS